ncbi:hypothetical protein ACFOHU_11120 [Ottowia pentelensis]|uniref:Sel1 repeat family protein n=1 Tax=Ottowia pentelensis TaxID=511108 RepID=A0ABV6PS08_9BURK
MNSISLDAVAALTGIGRSTLWRKLADGALAKGEKDARGRATVALADVLGLIGEGTRVAFSDADLAVLLQADAGDAQAQADIGALLQVHGGREAALYWLQAAAEQGSAEAMQWLGTAHAAKGTEQGDQLAVMWIAKAAALGHPIARRQLDGLLQGAAVGPADGGAQPAT